MKTSTNNNYRKRLNDVIEYIHNNLDGDLSVNVLAEVAIMSPYHFHRIYREIVQETLNVTIRRLRLQRAATELINSNQSIANIAKQVSYGSTEAFSRAFNKQFGVTPSLFREQKNIHKVTLEPFQKLLFNIHNDYDEKYEVKLINNASMNLYGYHHQGDYTKVSEVFKKLFIFAGENNLLNQETRSIGVFFDDPQSVNKEQLRSIACITRPDNTEISGNNAPASIQIPAGKCATLTFKGPHADLEKPFNWLFGEWLPNSGYEAADFPLFEEYLNDLEETSPNELLTRIYCLLA